MNPQQTAPSSCPLRQSRAPQSDVSFACVSLSAPSPAAAQTAAIALHTHPTVGATGITLLRSAREIKGVGSLDSVRGGSLLPQSLLG